MPLGVVEKDHAITVALGALAALECAEEMVFKGGTALRKVYFEGHRFSEDLDFTLRSDVAPAILSSEKALLEAGRHADVRFTGLRTVRSRLTSRSLAIPYEDMNGHKNHIRLELSLRERVQLPAERRPIQDPYGVLEKRTWMPTMALPEILAEKVRALHMRTQARDLYDLRRLLSEGVPLNIGLVEAKLAWWKKGMRYEPSALKARIDHVGATWERDLRPLLDELPSFEAVSREVRFGLGVRD